MDQQRQGPIEQGARPTEEADRAGSSEKQATDSHGRQPLFSEEELGTYRKRWEEVQAGFVDEPRGSVEQADELITTLMDRLAKTFADERAQLEAQWEKSSDASTEDLRRMVQRYRSFFDRLLAA